jgi:type VI secretion system secreted protein Hcp
MKKLSQIPILLLLVSLAFSNFLTAQITREFSTRDVKPAVFTGDSKAIGYVSVQATKQGKFKGDDPGLLQKSEFIDYSFSLTAAMDPVTGAVTGKNKYSAVTIIKKNGCSTPQFLQALFNNETLSYVLFEFVKTQTDGTKKVYYTVKLTNAYISRMAQLTNKDDLDLKSGSYPLDEISIMFKKIEVTYTDGGVVAEGDND